MNGMEVLEIKEEEVESKPTNVEEAIKSGWKPAKEMYEVAGVDRRTWENFMVDVRNAISKKPDSSCEIDFTTEKCITGPHNTKYYHPKVEEAFQLWLMKNQANQGRASEVVKQATTQAVEKDWYSLEELSQITGYGKDKLNHLLTETSFVQMSKAHSKLGGYHNSQKFYDDYMLKAIKAYQLKAHGNMINADQANQTTANILSKAEQMMDLQTIAESGNVDAMKQFMNRMVAYTQIQAENKRLLEQTKQMEHALNYTAVIGWKKWSELKKELAQNFELLRHKINYTKLFDEVGLVENEDYKRKVMGFDKFPTVLISPEAEDMLWDWLDGHH